MPDYHFTVKNHPVGFIIEAQSEDEALQEYKRLSMDGISGIQGFTIDDIISVEVVS